MANSLIKKAMFTQYNPESKSGIHCGHCGISGCCSSLDCLSEILLKNPECLHGDEYFIDLAVSWELSRWILQNARVLLKNVRDLDHFHERIEKAFCEKVDQDLLIDLHNQWDDELIDIKLKRSSQRWSDQDM